MKIEDYVRTKNKPFQPSQIAKIKNIEKDMVYKGQKCLNLDHNLLTTYEFLIYEEDIINSSTNIIDLLKVGDYVNGYRVIEKDISDELRYIDLKDRNMKYVKNLDIKSIVTKEQFESMEYKIGEIK